MSGSTTTPLHDFFRFSAVGSIRLGATPEMVREALGEPEDTGNPKTIRWPHRLWSYGDHSFQLGFEHGRLFWFGFILVNQGSPRLPSAWGGGPLPFNDRTNVEEMCSWLRGHGIPCNLPPETVYDSLLIRCGERTTLQFDAESRLLEKVMVG